MQFGMDIYGLLTCMENAIQASMELDRRRKELVDSLKGKVVEILDDLPGQILQKPLFSSVHRFSQWVFSVIRGPADDADDKGTAAVSISVSCMQNPYIEIPCHVAASPLFLFLLCGPWPLTNPPLYIWHAMA